VLHPQQHYFPPCRQDQHDFLLQRHCGLQQAEQRPLPTTLDSLVGPPASVTSVLLGSPGMSPQPPPRSRSFCCCPQVSGTPDQISDDELRIPRLHGPFPPHPFAHAAPPSPADSADEVLIPCFLHRPLWFRVIVMLRFLSRAPVFLAFSPPPPFLLFALNLPCRLAAFANAPSGMDNSDLLLLLPPPPSITQSQRCCQRTPPAPVSYLSPMLLISRRLTCV
jgi:hypothetical protein